MKFTTARGNVITRDHPHEIISPFVMTFETIRWWLKELSTNKEYGWYPKGRAGLERALGMANGAIKWKLEDRWIWPKEQVRLTARINDIIDGRIVPKKILIRGKRGAPRIEGVVTDPPQPPKVTRPREIRMNATLKGISFVPPPKRMVLPAFKEVFKDVRVWNPDDDPM